MFQSVLDSLRYPIWQAPTASIAGPELAAAASRAGGMGSMGLTWAEPEVAAEHVRQVRSQTDSPFFVNFALAFPPHALDAALEAGAPIVAFSWGDSEPCLAKVRAAGAQVGIQVTNVAGTRRAVSQGADFLICQGNEAGGHVQSNTPLWDLLPRTAARRAILPPWKLGSIEEEGRAGPRVDSQRRLDSSSSIASANAAPMPSIVLALPR